MKPPSHTPFGGRRAWRAAAAGIVQMKKCCAVSYFSSLFLVSVVHFVGVIGELRGSYHGSYRDECDAGVQLSWSYRGVMEKLKWSYRDECDAGVQLSWNYGGVMEKLKWSYRDECDAGGKVSSL